MKNRAKKILATLSAAGVLFGATACSKTEQVKSIQGLRDNDTINSVISGLYEKGVGVDDILWYKVGTTSYSDSDKVEYVGFTDWYQIYRDALLNKDYNTARIYLWEIGSLIVKDSLEDELGVSFLTFKPSASYGCAFVTYKDKYSNEINRAGIRFKDELGKNAIEVLRSLCYDNDFDEERLRNYEHILMQYLCTMCISKDKSCIFGEEYDISNPISNVKTKILSNRK